MMRLCLIELRFELKKFFTELHALDLLAPELLRQRTRDAGNSLGLGGEKLSAFLHEIGEAKRVSIQVKLAKIYPRFRHLDILSLRSGWKSLIVQEQFGDTIVTLRTVKSFAIAFWITLMIIANDFTVLRVTKEGYRSNRHGQSE